MKTSVTPESVLENLDNAKKLLERMIKEHKSFRCKLTALQGEAAQMEECLETLEYDICKVRDYAKELRFAAAAEGAKSSSELFSSAEPVRL
jgi:cell division septum initiation protein DivIVA